MYYYKMSSVPKLMIKIWYHSMHHLILIDKKSCTCKYFISCCMISAKKRMNKNYVDFNIAVFHFRTLKKELFDIMVLKDEKLKERLVDEYLRDQKNNKLF